MKKDDTEKLISMELSMNPEDLTRFVTALGFARSINQSIN